MSELIQPTEETKAPRLNGRYRLAIFGVVAILIALVTSGVSLFVYTVSGDIYLDRSRPGFISDNDSSFENDETSQTNVFPPDGPITVGTIDDYLRKLDTLVQDITSDSTAFSSDALSDEALNISGSADF